MITSNEKMILPPGITIRNHFEPGDVGTIVYLHGSLYAREHGWDHTFEAYVAGPLAEFVNSSSARERIWIVEKDGVVAGSVAIVETSPNAGQLRWFILHPDLRGLGLGRILIEQIIAFCRECQYHSIFLWTVSILEAAANLYSSVGFELIEQKKGQLGGVVVTEHKYVLSLQVKTDALK